MSALYLIPAETRTVTTSNGKNVQLPAFSPAVVQAYVKEWNGAARLYVGRAKTMFDFRNGRFDDSFACPIASMSVGEKERTSKELSDAIRSLNGSDVFTSGRANMYRTFDGLHVLLSMEVNSKRFEVRFKQSDLADAIQNGRSVDVRAIVESEAVKGFFNALPNGEKTLEKSSASDAKSVMLA